MTNNRSKIIVEFENASAIQFQIEVLESALNNAAEFTTTIFESSAEVKEIENKISALIKVLKASISIE